MSLCITNGACARGDDRDVNDEVFDGLSITDASFHPTQKGYDPYNAIPCVYRVNSLQLRRRAPAARYLL